MSILFERRHEPLLPLRIFWRRWAVFVASATGLVLFSLLAGMVGYCYFEKMGAVDAFENAAMILSGMGPADALHTEAGKLFAGIFALYSGLVFVTASSLLVIPVAHRLLHHFHLESGRDPS